MSDIAIAHKDYAVAGGGEILAERLGLAFDAPVYAGYVKDRNRADLRADVRGLWNNGLTNKLLQRGGMTRALLYQHLWETVPELHDYDVVIQSGNEPLWYLPLETQTTVAYTHSTPRLMYDLHTRKAVEGADSDGYWNPFATAKGLLAGWIRKKQRARYRHVVDYPDMFVANSDLVARRIERYWAVSPDRIRTVYPPVAVDEYGPEHASRGSSEYYLSINRLDKWKRIDEIVRAFNERDDRLVIAGKGPAKPRLEKLADGNIEFVGYVSDEEKKRLLAGAKAVVYNPLNEDFGMVPIEALASGTPVVSVRDGFQRWQLEDGTQAILYDRDYRDADVTVRNLRQAIGRFENDGVRGDAGQLQASVEHYAVERFNREMRAAVDEARERGRIEPELPPSGIEPEPPAPDAETPAPEPAVAKTDGGTQE